VQLVSKISDLCDPDPPTSQTDRRTDGQTTCDRNTALCTKVHRAVKTDRYSQLALYRMYTKQKATVNKQAPVYYGSGTGWLREMTSWPLSWTYDVISVVQSDNRYAYLLEELNNINRAYCQISSRSDVKRTTEP